MEPIRARKMTPDSRPYRLEFGANVPTYFVGEGSGLYGLYAPGDEVVDGLVSDDWCLSPFGHIGSPCLFCTWRTDGDTTETVEE